MLRFLLATMLLYLGFYLSYSKILEWISKFSKKDSPARVVSQYKNAVFKYIEYIAIASFILGLVALIAPTPVQVIENIPIPHKAFVTYRFVGDLIPSLICILVSIAVSPKILTFFSLPDKFKDQVMNITKNYSIILGIIAIVFGFIHLFLGKSNLL